MYRPLHSDHAAIRQSYDWYPGHRALGRPEQASHHKSPVRKGLLAALAALIRPLPG